MQKLVNISSSETRQKTKFPEWLRKPLPSQGALGTASILKDLKLNTVCEEARCPNRTECWSRKTATFMLLGDVCTRNCQYCSVSHGKPIPVDEQEPERVAEACAKLGLRHVVLTSVNRDDLSDGGARIFRETIRQIRMKINPVTVEVLTPDFKGDMRAVDIVCEARPEVFNHNLETIKRLFPSIRPGGRYERSLDFLRYVKSTYPSCFLKSGLMVGLGETDEELEVAFNDLAKAGCDILTLGQYLKPEAESCEVARFVTPDEFAAYKAKAHAAGIRHVYSGPFIRSSYLADDVLKECQAAAQSAVSVNSK